MEKEISTVPSFTIYGEQVFELRIFVTAMFFLVIFFIFGLPHFCLSIIIVDDANITMRPKKSSSGVYSVSVDHVTKKNGYYYDTPTKVEIEEIPQNIPSYNIDEKYKIDQDGYKAQMEQDKLLQTIIMSNPLLAALVIAQTLHLSPTTHGYNSLNHLPTNPYVSLLLSHYGRYINPPSYHQRGIYGYSASNNYHNNQPFGSYKIYEESRK